jgi:tRNA (guanine-N7-)-methyltransferase
MTKRLRQHVNPLKMTSLVPRSPLVLPNGPAVDVELGCADARFLIELAEREPARHLVGLDIREAFLVEGHAEIAQRGLRNVQLEECNLIVDADHLFAPGRVARFFINFPDPWFKRRQHQRRWLAESTLDALVRALEPGGEILFQSDVWMLALEALGLLEAHVGLNNTCGPWTFLRKNPVGVCSTREEICEAEQRKIWRLLFRKEPSRQGW